MTGSTGRPPLRVLLLRDQSPGHYHQVEGLALCLSRVAPVEFSRVEVRRHFKLGLLTYVVNRWRFLPGLWLRLLFRLGKRDIGRPDAVIGSGNASIGAGILIRRMTGVPFVLSGVPKDFDTREISLIMMPAPEFATEPNMTFVPIPTTVDRDRLPEPRRLATRGDLRGATLGLLLGGRASGYKYRLDEWRSIVDLVETTAVQFGLRWRVSTSQRTVPEAVDMFGDLTGRGLVEVFVDFRKAGPGSSAPIFEADAIVVTEDSRSMAAEAVAAGRPVILLKPDAVEPIPARRRVDATIAAGGMVVLPIAEASAERFADVLLAVSPPPYDPRDLIAAAVAPVIGLTPFGHPN